MPEFRRRAPISSSGPPDAHRGGLTDAGRALVASICALNALRLWIRLVAHCAAGRGLATSGAGATASCSLGSHHLAGSDLKPIADPTPTSANLSRNRISPVSGRTRQSLAWTLDQSRAEHLLPGIDRAWPRCCTRLPEVCRLWPRVRPTLCSTRGDGTMLCSSSSAC